MIPVLILLLLAGPACGETILLSQPRAAVCVASPDAEYVLEQGELKPVRGFFAFSPPGEPPLQPAITTPGQAFPGDMVRVRVRSAEPLESLVVLLTDMKSRQVSRTSVFRLETGTGDAGLPAPAAGPACEEQWAALAGIPSTVAPGRYMFEVRAGAGDRSCLLRAPVTVSAKVFAAEAIDLTGSLSTLRSTPDARKTEEARALARVLTQPHPEALMEMGALVLPITAGWRRTGGFGDRRSYRYADGGTDRSIHNGLDMAAPTGTPVAACGKGRVVLAGERIMTGKTVVVEHLPGLFSIYYHLAETLVREGDVLSAGQALGKVGMTGFATGPHLHWEVQVMGMPVDPEGLVRMALLDTGAGLGDIGTHTGSEGR